MPGSRVYLDLTSSQDSAMITLKNISASPLSVSAESLMERFVRGDSARTSEGSGLGLAIARGLTELQNGHFSIETDGDLFKAMVSLPLT
jgi:signal transduction histidine kinase